MTLSSKVGRIHQSILYSALKITSAEGKKEMVLEMEIFPFLSLYFLSFKKSTFKCTIKGSSVATPGKEQLQWGGGSQKTPPGGADLQWEGQKCKSEINPSLSLP